LRVGYTTAGRYKILEKLGQGGFGVVWKAADIKENNRICALKELLLLPITTYALEKFHQEAKILQELPPVIPGIPSLYRYFVDKVPIIIMEFIPGKNARNHYGPGQCSNQEAKWFLTESLTILSAVHENHYLHRDIKPDNIIIQTVPSKKLWLVDFGIAKEVVPEDTYATVVGTWLFMAPEAIIGATARWSDIYSLGATLVALQVPVESYPKALCGWGAVLEQCNLQPDLKAIISKMIAVNFTERFQSCQSVIDQLNVR